MKKLISSILGLTALGGITFGADVVPYDMPYVGESFEYQCNGVMRTAVDEQGNIVRAAFDPEPCVGVHTYSAYKDYYGSLQWKEITRSRYALMGQKDGFLHNPVKETGFRTLGSLMLSEKAEAAIAFNDVDWDSLGGSGTSKTTSINSGTGDDRFLFSHPLCNGGVSVSSVTYDGAGMTNAANNGTGGVAAFYIFNPTSGANNEVITCSASASNIVSNIASYTGAGSPIDNTGGATGSGTSISRSMIATSSDAWMIAGLRYDSSGDPFTMTSGTKRTDADSPDNNQIIADSNASTTCDSPSCTIAATHVSGNDTLMAVMVAPAVAAAATPVDDTSFEIISYSPSSTKSVYLGLLSTLSTIGTRTQEVTQEVTHQLVRR